MVQRRGAKPNPARPTSVFELNKFVSVINFIYSTKKVKEIVFEGLLQKI